MKNIGVIGAGAAGICALRHILSKEGLTPIVWEHGSDIGGTWIYNPDVGKDDHGFPIHSSMYKNLTTNLPKEIMAYPDFPFKAVDRSFLHHTEVLQYLNDYVDHFNLRPWIKFSHHVEWVEPVKKEGSWHSWKVKVKNLKEETTEIIECDALFICNGHYSTPKLPNIENINSFQGSVMHSHDYRVPDAFADKSVVILGASASGLDIALEVATVAKKVYLSHNLPVPFPSKLPNNIEQVKGVKGAEPSGFFLLDETFVEANSIIYCTGYEYTFPFLSPECGLSVEDNQVKPLHKHVIHARFPSLAFIGIPLHICPFPVFDAQVQYFLRVLGGQLPLADPAVLEAEIEVERSQKLAQGLPARYFHKMSKFQWPYVYQLADEGKFGRIPAVYERIYLDNNNLRTKYLTQYKKNKYSIIGDGSFTSTFDSKEFV